MAVTYGLTQRDRDGLRKLARDLRAGRGPLSRRPLPRRKRVVGSSSGSQGRFSMAIVTDDCGASSYGSLGITGGTVGKCVLLDEDGAAVKADGTGFSDIGDAVDDDKIEFKALIPVIIPAGAIVRLECDSVISAGSTWDGADDTRIAKVWADVYDARRALKYLSTYTDGDVLRGVSGLPDWEAPEAFACPEP